MTKKKKVVVMDTIPNWQNNGKKCFCETENLKGYNKQNIKLKTRNNKKINKLTLKEMKKIEEFHQESNN